MNRHREGGKKMHRRSSFQRTIIYVSSPSSICSYFAESRGRVAVTLFAVLQCRALYKLPCVYSWRRHSSPEAMPEMNFRTRGQHVHPDGRTERGRQTTQTTFSIVNPTANRTILYFDSCPLGARKTRRHQDAGLRFMGHDPHDGHPRHA